MITQFLNWLLSGPEVTNAFPVLTDLFAILIDFLVVILLATRLIRYQANGGYFLILRISMGILCVAETYQIISCGSRLLGANLGADFRGSWILKDIGIALYVYCMTYTNWRIGGFSKEVDNLVYHSADHKHDKRFHDISESDSLCKKP